MTELVPLKNNNAGYVYILSNPSMPCLLKIGMSTRGAEERSAELYSTGVPTPFILEFEIYSDECFWLETRAHELFDKNRVSASREFFNIETEDAIRGLIGIYLEEYESVVMDFHFCDLIPLLYELVGKTGIEYNNYGDILKMFDSLKHLDSNSLLKASVKYDMVVEERKKKREAKALEEDSDGQA